MTKILLVTFCTLLTSFLWSVDFIYLDSINGEDLESRSTIIQDESGTGYLLTSDDKVRNMNHRIRLNEKMETLEWYFEEGEDRIRIERKGDVLCVTGLRDGKDITMDCPIDNAPWYASMDTGLSFFSKTQDKEVEFWTISPEELKTWKMIAKKKGTETWKAGEVSDTALRVQVSASGIPALFFSMNFLMRQSDGLRLRFEGKTGGPGSPKMISNFVRME